MSDFELVTEQEKKKKGGRFKLPIEKKKTICKKIYFTLDEYEYLLGKYELFGQSNKHISEKFREILSTGKSAVVKPLCRQQIQDLNNLGKNLNQLVKLVHQNNNILLTSEVNELFPLLTKLKIKLLPQGEE